MDAQCEQLKSLRLKTQPSKPHYCKYKNKILGFPQTSVFMNYMNVTETIFESKYSYLTRFVFVEARDKKHTHTQSGRS